MHTHSLAEYMDCIDRDDWRGVADLMLSSARKLESGGADFLICPDNTIHRSFNMVEKDSPLPWLHIVEEVAAEAKRRGFQRVAITGTRYTMEGSLYPEVLGRHGIDYRVPPPPDRDGIHRIIFDERVNGIFTSESEKVFRGIIERMGSEGCDAAVLGCTELPLIMAPESSPLPLLDSTRLLARAALRRAIGGPGN